MTVKSCVGDADSAVDSGECGIIMGLGGGEFCGSGGGDAGRKSVGMLGRKAVGEIVV